jgi:polyhydroxybutyrate depolymerase
VYRILSVLIIAVGALSACGGGGGGNSPSTEQVFRYSETITVDSRPRTYTLNLPPNYYDAAAVPLVIALHGGGGGGAQFESTSLLTPIANAAGFAVVYPDGSAQGALELRTWNGGGCCGYAVEAAIDDVNFIRQLSVSLASRFKIDPKRVYATGHSNGAILSYRLACELSDRIAAIAPNAGELLLATCTPSRPIPILHMHSKLDTQVPYLGGVGTGLSGVNFPSLASVMGRWVGIDTCLTPSLLTVVSGRYIHEKWPSCAAGTAVEYYLTDDGGHGWPGGLPGRTGSDTPSTAIDANDLSLAFFNLHRLP